jgi:hypothetical protein
MFFSILKPFITDLVAVGKGAVSGKAFISPEYSPLRRMSNLLVQWV